MNIDKTHLQTIVFPKKKFTKEEAEQFLKNNGLETDFKGKGVDEKKLTYRYRQQDQLKKDKAIFDSVKQKKTGIVLTYQYPKD